MSILAAGRRRGRGQSLTSRTEWELTGARTTPAGIDAYLAALAAEDHGKTVTLGNYGLSGAGHPLRMVTIGTGTGRPIIVQAGIHADEPQPIEAALTFTREILESRTLNGFLAARRIIVLPALSPDGTIRNVAGRDPNRDFVHCRLLQTRQYVALLTALQPIAVFDAHEQGPGPGRADVEYLTGLARAIPAGLVAHAMSTLDALRSALTAAGIGHAYYHTTSHGTNSTTNGLRGFPTTLAETKETADALAFRHQNMLVVMRAWLADVAARDHIYEAALESAQAEAAATTQWELTRFHPSPRTSAGSATLVTATGYRLDQAKYDTCLPALTAHGIPHHADGADWLVPLGHATSAVAVHLLDPQAPAPLVTATRLP